MFKPYKPYFPSTRLKVQEKRRSPSSVAASTRLKLIEMRQQLREAKNAGGVKEIIAKVNDILTSAITQLGASSPVVDQLLQTSKQLEQENTEDFVPESNESKSMPESRKSRRRGFAFHEEELDEDEDLTNNVDDSDEQVEALVTQEEEEDPISNLEEVDMDQQSEEDEDAATDAELEELARQVEEEEAELELLRDSELSSDDNDSEEISEEESSNSEDSLDEDEDSEISEEEESEDEMSEDEMSEDEMSEDDEVSDIDETEIQ